MTQYEKTTTFMGIDISNPPPRVQKALNHSTHPLDIQDYIKITDFEINSLMFSWFWQIMIDDNRSSHLGRPILEWFGYEGADWKSKTKFKELLDRNNVPYKEIAHDDTDAKNYPTIAEEAALLPNKGALAKQRFVIMNPRDIKEAIMMLNTKTAKIFRNYYLDLENLIKEYACYTACFKNRQLHLKDNRIDELMNQLKTMNMRSEEMNIRAEQRAIKQDEKINEMLEQNETLIELNKELNLNVKDVKVKLGIACVERAPLPEKSSKQERFLLLKRNDEDYPYYVIRAQYSNAHAAKKRQESVYTIEVLLDLKCHPNSKTLFVRIRDDLKKQGVSFSGNGINIEGSEDITEEKLIEVMKEINAEKFI